MTKSVTPIFSRIFDTSDRSKNWKKYMYQKIP